MKIIRGSLTPQAVPSSRGRVSVRDTKHGPVAQAWPGKRKRPLTEEEKFRQWQFGFVAEQCSKPLPPEYDTAVNMVKGTTEVPRDFLMACMYGVAYEIVAPDGFVWPVADHTLPITPPIPSQPEMPWTIHTEYNFTTQGAAGDVKAILTGEYTEALLLFHDVTCQTAGGRNVRFSTDGGSSFWAGATDYRNVPVTGNPTNSSGFGGISVLTALARTCAFYFPNLNVGQKCAFGFNWNLAFPLTQFVASDLPINGIQALAISGGNMTGGKVVILVR